MTMSHPTSFFRPRIEDKCCICHEGPEENNRKKWAVNVRCGHVYHSQCIKQAESLKYEHMVKLRKINELPKCPLYRKTYHPSDIMSENATNKKLFKSMMNQTNTKIQNKGDKSSSSPVSKRSVASSVSTLILHILILPSSEQVTR